MDKLKMHSMDMVGRHIEQIGALFPNCITETIKDGEIVRAIDFDMLRQELSDVVVEGPTERYQFTWPEKRKSVLAANAPINKTLRPVKKDETSPTGYNSAGEAYCSSGSIDFENTRNLYIEGDNLDVLKLLQETYLGKIKMIYIDPPYNTGSDFVYEDDFADTASEYLSTSGQYDDDGNRLVQNTESNGRFHTNWLNMIYPRIKLAKSLLTDDGVIFISIDDNEYDNLKRICDEVFGAANFIATIIRNTNSSKNQSLFVSVSHEYCLVYAKNIEVLKEKHKENKWSVPKNNVDEYVAKVKQLQKQGLTPEEITEELKSLTKYPRFIDFTNYWYFDDKGLYSKGDLGGVPNGNKTPVFNPITQREDPVPPGGFRFSADKMAQLAREGRIHFHTDGSLPRIKRYLFENMDQRPKSIMSDDQRPDSSMMQAFNTPFDNPKQLSFIKRICGIMDDDAIFLDFFSGSATTAHAVMQLNAEDGGSRKFIMVQLPEVTPAGSDARKAGYENICEIGKARIRSAAQKIADEHPGVVFDGGFRVLKLDTSNMEDVYYRPDEISMQSLFSMADNIKPDRTPEDLLFQVMLDLGILLDSKIEETVIAGKKVFSVADGYLIACFDSNVTDEAVKAIAQKQPYYAVFRDSGFATDSVATNFEQIFETYSPSTTRKVL